MPRPCRAVLWRESAELAAAPIRQAVQAEGCITRPRVLHADNGSPMKGATMKVTHGESWVSGPPPAGRASATTTRFCEALFRTCKYRPDWPTKGFASKADAQAWVKSFTNWYNGEHLHSAIRFVTPEARHAGHDVATLASRASLHAKARAQNPERRSGKARNWQPAGPVWLNPEREISVPETREAA